MKLLYIPAVTISDILVRSRKPRPVSQLVAQQVNQQFAPPTHPKKDKKEKSEKDRSDKEPTLKRKSHKKTRYSIQYSIFTVFKSSRQFSSLIGAWVSPLGPG